MSKELKALKYLKENKRKHWLDDDKSTECLDTIETALKNYEEGLYHAETYVKHTSSQALFDLLGLALKNVDRRYWKLPEQLYDDVNKTLKRKEWLELECNGLLGQLEDYKYINEPKVKAFEIIKEKEMLSVFKDIGSGKCYLAFNTTAIEIPQEEYDVLKEVL